jgi:TolB-like protein
VLPFVFIGPEAKDAYLADGFTEEIMSDLAGLNKLRVISRTSSMALRDSGENAVTLGKRLGVNYLLEGAVRSGPEKLRVSVSLIDANRDRRIWGEKLDGAPDAIFDMQEEIARAVVKALKIQLSPVEDRQLSERAINDLEAWRYAQQARQACLRWRKDAIDHSIALLNRGLALVGDNIELLASLGRAWLQYREAGIDAGPGPLEQAEACSFRIEAIDPGTISGLQLKAWILYSRGDIKKAVTTLRAALEKDPGNADTLNLLSNCYLIAGRVSQARPLIDQLLGVDPLTPLSQCMPGWASVLDGDPEAALTPYRRMFEMDPGNPMGRLFYLWVLVLNGRTDEALMLNGGFAEESRHSLPGEIAALYARALENSGAQDFSPEDPVTPEQCTSDVFPRLLAHVHALSGDADGAVRWLRVAVERGFINYLYLARHDLILRRLDSHEGFGQLLAEVRQRWEAFDD